MLPEKKSTQIRGKCPSAVSHIFSGSRVGVCKVWAKFANMVGVSLRQGPSSGSSNAAIPTVSENTEENLGAVTP